MTLDMKGTKSFMEAANIQRKKSENYLRTGLLKWKPHFKKAGDGFCKAALLYCEAGDVQGGVGMLIKASESYKCKRMWTSGAKTLEHAINLAIEHGDTSCIVDLAWKSAALYKKAGHPDCASQVLERAGQALKITNPEKNLMLLEKAAETVETENRPLHAAFYVKKLLLTALENKDFQYAISKAKQLIQLYQESGQTSQTGNYVLILVIINIVLQDLDKANLSASEFCNYCSSAQSKTIDDLLEGFEASNYSQISEALHSESIDCLHPVFDELIKNVWSSADKFKTIEPPKMEPIDSKDPKLTSTNLQDQPSEVEESSDLLRKLKSDFFKDSRMETGGDPQTTLASKQTWSVPTKRPALLKRATIAQIENGIISSKLEFGGMAESPKKNVLSRVKSVGPYFDVMGIDVVSPSQLGMTNDQWRETKKCRINEIQENETDSC